MYAAHSASETRASNARWGESGELCSTERGRERPLTMIFDLLGRDLLGYAPAPTEQPDVESQDVEA